MINSHPFKVIKLIANSYSVDPLTLVSLDLDNVCFKNIDNSLIESLLNDVIDTFDLYLKDNSINLLEYNTYVTRLYSLYYACLDNDEFSYFLDELFNLLKTTFPSLINYNLYYIKCNVDKSLFYVLEPIFISDSENLYRTVAYTIYNFAADKWTEQNRCFFNQ